MIHGIQEEWKPVVGLEQRYEVSSEGRVRNKKTARILKTHLNGSGYPVLWLYLGHSKEKPFFVHRLVGEAFLGAKPRNLTTNHIDGRKENARANNLEYVTQARNNQHAYDIGLRERVFARGKAVRRIEPNPNRKLNAEDVTRMRELSTTVSYRTLGAFFNIHHETARRIVQKRTWKSL